MSFKIRKDIPIPVDKPLRFELREDSPTPVAPTFRRWVITDRSKVLVIASEIDNSKESLLKFVEFLNEKVGQ